MKKLEDVGVLVARILMPILFITAGWGKITGYAGTQQYMEAMGVPGALLPLTILLEFGGGLAILFGFLTRTTALFTAGFTPADRVPVPQQLC
ncbi:Inner membrane protein yqjF [Raoultella planticola]|uniref:Inner membrane protein yqjF n=1 Tax=Raoultella planticola TaxID=575 RepID=A0A485D9S9_RAOPL|nr:Inner membrane protein yqjF [Raoultella planticola]